MHQKRKAPFTLGELVFTYSRESELPSPRLRDAREEKKRRPSGIYRLLEKAYNLNCRLKLPSTLIIVYVDILVIDSSPLRLDRSIDRIEHPFVT